ncbi:MAG: PPOX class F420-dependent oxidoreductase [Acidimicrobiales bacterium]
MTDDQIRTFMRTGSRTGKLATVRADGRPHIAPVWFEFDDTTGEAVFLTGTQTLKGRNMRRDPRVSICVDEMEFPFAFARLDGEAHMVENDPDLVHWATETCRRYVGDDRAVEFGRRNASPAESLVRVTITRLVGATGISD